jgi:hypothetical protein
MCPDSVHTCLGFSNENAALKDFRFAISDLWYRHVMQIWMRYANNVEHGKIPRSTSVNQSEITSLPFEYEA